MKIENSYIFEEATRIYQENAISFDFISQKFEGFHRKTLIVMILCFRQWHIFHKLSVFQRSKGRGHENFSHGQPPDSRFARFARASFQPAPNRNFVPTDLICPIDVLYCAV